MSSRFDYDGDEGAMPIALWQANVRRAIAGKRGQKALRDVETALLALPSKRLLSGELVDHQAGEVCVVGALGIQREMRAGKTFAEAIEELPYVDNDFETAEYGTTLGLTMTLAWRLAEVNDERFGHKTPEERYEAVLGWVRDQLAPVASQTAAD